MPKVTKEYQVVIVLELDEEEANWLKNLMQNPIGALPQDIEESEIDREMREAFWQSLGGN